MGFLEKYRVKGDVVFESIMTSVRLLEPSIGMWIAANKDNLTVLTLTTTLKECEAGIAERKTKSIAGTKWNSKTLLLSSGC